MFNCNGVLQGFKRSSPDNFKCPSDPLSPSLINLRCANQTWLLVPDTYYYLLYAFSKILYSDGMGKIQILLFLRFRQNLKIFLSDLQFWLILPIVNGH